MTIDPNKTYTATVETDGGTFTITLDAKTGPETVNNFVFLADQASTTAASSSGSSPASWPDGDPTGTGTGGPATPSRTRPQGVLVAVPAGRWPWRTPASRTPTAASSSSSRGRGRDAPAALRALRPGHARVAVVETINDDGNPAQGTPPDVTHRILSVTIAERPADPTQTAAREDHHAHRGPSPDGSSPKQPELRRPAADVHRPGEALHRRHGDVEGHDHDRARPGRRARDGQQLRLPRPVPLLRRHRLPPDHPGLRAPGRRPDGDRPGGPGYRFADELPEAGRYEIGSLAMANAGPDTNGSQFFVISGPDGVRLRRSTPCSARWSPGSTSWRRSTPSAPPRASPPRG